MTEDTSVAAATIDEIEVESTEVVETAAADSAPDGIQDGAQGGAESSAQGSADGSALDGERLSKQHGHSRGDAHEDLVAEGDAAGDYLERLLDILDYDGDIDLDVEGERAVVSIVGEGDVDKLVGENGEVLSALQELTRLAAGMETGTRSRLMLDVAGFRARRREELTVLGRETAEKVVESGVAARLGSMNPFERKVVHDAVATVVGATSASEGEEPRRRVVVSPTE